MASSDTIAIVGGGPAGMAAALALNKVGFKVAIYERYSRALAAGFILSLWPPPIHALKCMGVDIGDLGAPCDVSYRNAQGHVRATVKAPDAVRAEYGGMFLGLLRPDLYQRMLDAIPAGVMHFDKQLVGIDDDAGGDKVRLTFADGAVVRSPLLIGADGIDSIVRQHLWGETAPKRRHDIVVIGGFTLAPDIATEPGTTVVVHDDRVQGSYSPIRSRGRDGHQWWVLLPWPDAAPLPDNVRAFAQAAAVNVPPPLGALIAATAPEDTTSWRVRDRAPLDRWSRGRVTLAGDAAHATSPYAAYGAGMSICDGHFLARVLAGRDLGDTAAVTAALRAYDDARIPHTTSQVQQAYYLGRLFHRVPWPLSWLRDLVLDRTRLLQAQVGERSPAEILTQLDEMGDLPVVAREEETGRPDGEFSQHVAPPPVTCSESR